MRRLNPESSRCCVCDQKLRTQADLIQHQLEHRGSAEELASGLEQAADAGLRAEAERDNPDNGNRYDNSAAVVIPDFAP